MAYALANSLPTEESPQHEETPPIEIVNYEIIYTLTSCPSPTKSKIFISTDNPMYVSIDHLNTLPTSNITTSSTENIQALLIDSVPTSPNVLDCTISATSSNIDCS